MVKSIKSVISYIFFQNIVFETKVFPKKKQIPHRQYKPLLSDIYCLHINPFLFYISFLLLFLYFVYAFFLIYNFFVYDTFLLKYHSLMENIVPAGKIRYYTIRSHINGIIIGIQFLHIILFYFINSIGIECTVIKS